MIEKKKLLFSILLMSPAMMPMAPAMAEAATPSSKPLDGIGKVTLSSKPLDEPDASVNEVDSVNRQLALD